MGNCLYRYNNSQYSYDHEEIEKYIEQLDERRNRQFERQQLKLKQENEAIVLIQNSQAQVMMRKQTLSSFDENDSDKSYAKKENYKQDQNQNQNQNEDKELEDENNQNQSKVEIKSVKDAQLPSSNAQSDSEEYDIYQKGRGRNLDELEEQILIYFNMSKTQQ
ncbi:hypothetical protein pb186bvf_010665 [Paramecium bursaria]